MKTAATSPTKLPNQSLSLLQPARPVRQRAKFHAKTRRRTKAQRKTLAPLRPALRLCVKILSISTPPTFFEEIHHETSALRGSSATLSLHLFAGQSARTADYGSGSRPKRSGPAHQGRRHESLSAHRNTYLPQPHPFLIPRS